jgi:hypothetical protein
VAAVSGHRLLCLLCVHLRALSFNLPTVISCILAEFTVGRTRPRRTPARTTVNSTHPLASRLCALVFYAPVRCA